MCVCVCVWMVGIRILFFLLVFYCIHLSLSARVLPLPPPLTNRPLLFPLLLLSLHPSLSIFHYSTSTLSFPPKSPKSRLYPSSFGSSSSSSSLADDPLNPISSTSICVSRSRSLSLPLFLPHSSPFFFFPFLFYPSSFPLGSLLASPRH